MLQEDLEQRSVVIITEGTKISAKILAKAMKKALKQMQKTPRGGRRKLKQLVKIGGLESIEIADSNIKSFDPIARKYGVSYALEKDTSSEPPKWLVFFNARDADAMTAAFKEYAAKTLKREADRPSVREMMQKLRDGIQHSVRDKIRQKHREGPEL